MVIMPLSGSLPINSLSSSDYLLTTGLGQSQNRYAQHDEINSFPDLVFRLYTFCVCTNSASDIKLSILINLNFGGQGIGPAYEPRLFRKMTSEISAGVGGGYSIADGSFEFSYVFFKLNEMEL